MAHSQDVLLETPRFVVVRHRRTTADGKTIVRDGIEHPGSAVIVPLLEDGSVCLIRNRRDVVDEVLIELPAGTLDADEDPAETARRELAEETGYRCASLRKLHEFFLSPGILSERMHLFLATGLVEGTAALEVGEEIATMVVSWEEAIAMVIDRRIHDAKTILGLLLYDRLRQRAGD